MWSSGQGIHKVTSQLHYVTLRLGAKEVVLLQVTVAKCVAELHATLASRSVLCASPFFDHCPSGFSSKDKWVSSTVKRHAVPSNVRKCQFKFLPFVDDSLTCAAMIYTKVASLTVICATCSGYATIVCVAVAFLTIIPASSGFPGFGIFIFKDSRGFIALSPLIIAASHPTAARIVTNIKWAFFEYKRTLITCIMFFLDPFQHTPLNLSLGTAQP